jgi:hypothetical protein
MPNQITPVKSNCCSLCDVAIIEYNPIRKKFQCSANFANYFITFDNGQIMNCGLCKDCKDSITDEKVNKIILRHKVRFANDIKEMGQEKDDNSFYKKIDKLKVIKHSAIRKNAVIERDLILNKQ